MTDMYDGDMSSVMICIGPLVCSVLCTAENCNPHFMGLATDGMGTGVFCFSSCARL